ncbi:hypothetical protein DPMN_052883 [Dreissena polymorpha]|uniref:Uncharacterized protein n=1 Tax=Dreissena polymorpha TaxID=45954 RepID=A0A9D4CLM4_DREPO|nr:hypothetical protein DPMN_052883 [Dreissena polymorpha]
MKLNLNLGTVEVNADSNGTRVDVGVGEEFLEEISRLLEIGVHDARAGVQNENQIRLCESARLFRDKTL